jgi:drug/metabolite transporter (DMT)-like permease
MIYLLICILSSTLIFVIFKIAGRNRIDNHALIVINYIVAAALGTALGGSPLSAGVSDPGWYIMALLTGILFIVVFVIMAATTQKAGMAVSTIAAKMSVAVPIIFSIKVFNETVTPLKIIAIIFALIALLLTIYRKNVSRPADRKALLFPLLLFAGAGTVDSMVKYSQEVYIHSSQSVQFSTLLFIVSAISGIIVLSFKPVSRREVIKPRVIVAGVTLGIVNFGSLWGLINALESRIFDSSVLFGINNLGIVMISVLIALLIFNEKLLMINRIGIILSIIAIIILSMV